MTRCGGAGGGWSLRRHLPDPQTPGDDADTAVSRAAQREGGRPTSQARGSRESVLVPEDLGAERSGGHASSMDWGLGRELHSPRKNSTKRKRISARAPLPPISIARQWHRAIYLLARSVPRHLAENLGGEATPERRDDALLPHRPCQGQELRQSRQGFREPPLGPQLTARLGCARAC